ncbi:MAG TPA: histidine--tRNA ligase [Gemmatimonadales bacterium]|nr:histidine--tRNA ligase [Gemmatimonadales bacterium]
MAQGALPGFRDFYPDDLAERAHIMDAWRRVARRAAFEEYDGPPLEPLELYTRKSGEEIVGQLYSFEDKGGRPVSLRPEMTPTFARMVGARANALRKPVRWFSMPQLFRYERAQRGRLREHFQLNVDIVGESDVLADAELLSVACGICAELGLGAEDVRARVSDRRLLNALLDSLGITELQRGAVYAAVDKMGRESREALTARMTQAGVGEAAISDLFALCELRDLDALRERAGGAGQEEFDRLARYRDAVNALGFGDWLVFDLSIVRGLAYYTGIVFELFDAKGELRAICGGGRYDTLLATLGGADLPALGFGLGDVVLGELLRDRGLMPARQHGADVWVVAAEGTEPHDVLGLVGYLRNETFSVDYVLNEEKLRTQRTGAQLKAAQKSGARSSAILHPDGRVELREMRAGGAEPLVLDRESLAAELRKRVPGAIDGSATISTATSNE